MDSCVRLAITVCTAWIVLGQWNIGPHVVRPCILEEDCASVMLTMRILHHFSHEMHSRRGYALCLGPLWQKWLTARTRP